MKAHARRHGSWHSALSAPARCRHGGGTEMAAQGCHQRHYARSSNYQEMAWFVDAAKPYRGMTVRVASEQIGTHFYERDVLAKGVQRNHRHQALIHETIPEGKLVDTLFEQMNSGRNFYDAYVNDTDSIGRHSRSNQTVALSAFMARGQGCDAADAGRVPISSAAVSASGWTASCISCRISSSPICTGFATTGSAGRS